MSGLSTTEAAAAHYRALPREGRLPGRCEMRLPEGLEGARVLDLLCREGKGAFKLADRVGGGGFVLACDPDAARIARAEGRRADAEAAGEPWAARCAFRCGLPEDLRALGAADADFDLVYVNASLNVVYDFDAVLAEAARVLAPGGRLWVAGLFAADGASALPEAEAAAAAAGGNVFSAARSLPQMEAAGARAGFRSCSFFDVCGVAPDGDDAAPELVGRRFVAADACLER